MCWCCLASVHVAQEHVWGRVPPQGSVCVFPGRVWLPGRVVAHRGSALPPQPKPSFEQSKKETQRAAAPAAPAEGPPSRQEQEAEKQAALNKGTALAQQVLLQQAPQACPGHGERPHNGLQLFPSTAHGWDPALHPQGCSAWCFCLSCSGHRAPPNQVSTGGGGGAHRQHAEEEHRRHGQRAGIQGMARSEGLGPGGRCWVLGWLWGLFCCRGAALLPSAMGRGWGEQSLHGSASRHPAGNLLGSAGASLCPRSGLSTAVLCRGMRHGWMGLDPAPFRGA